MMMIMRMHLDPAYVYAVEAAGGSPAKSADRIPKLRAFAKPIQQRTQPHATVLTSHSARGFVIS